MPDPLPAPLASAAGDAAPENRCVASIGLGVIDRKEKPSAADAEAAAEAEAVVEGADAMLDVSDAQPSWSKAASSSSNPSGTGTLRLDVALAKLECVLDAVLRMPPALEPAARPLASV